MKSTTMIRSLLDPVCWVKVRVLNIRKLNVRYGWLCVCLRSRTDYNYFQFVVVRGLLVW